MTTITIPLNQLPHVLGEMKTNFTVKVGAIGMNTTRKTARFMFNMAMRLAPEKDGHLKENIKLHLGKKQSSVTSTVNTQFKYNFWVDGRPGWTSWGRRYSQVNRTGYFSKGKGYFSTASDVSRKYGKDVTVRQLRKLTLL
jgi:hypothetical protein